MKNLHIITLYKLHSKLSCVSSESTPSSSTCRAHRATRARRVERVEPCCSTSSTRPKCIDSTRRTCRVESRRDGPSGIWAWRDGIVGVIWSADGKSQTGVVMNCLRDCVDQSCVEHWNWTQWRRQTTALQDERRTPLARYWRALARQWLMKWANRVELYLSGHGKPRCNWRVAA